MKNELNNNDKHKEVKATKKWFMKWNLKFEDFRHYLETTKQTK